MLVYLMRILSIRKGQSVKIALSTFEKIVCIFLIKRLFIYLQKISLKNSLILKIEIYFLSSADRGLVYTSICYPLAS